MFVCLSVCLYVCMSVCLYVCMSVCLSICLCTYLDWGKVMVGDLLADGWCSRQVWECSRPGVVPSLILLLHPLDQFFHYRCTHQVARVHNASLDPLGYRDSGVGETQFLKYIVHTHRLYASRCPGTQSKTSNPSDSSDMKY
mgnify:CR=1 FL=1